MSKISTAALCLLPLALAGCHHGLHRSKVSLDEATKINDASQTAWTSMDAGKIKAVYAPGIVGFDVTYGPLVTDRAQWDKLQDNFSAARLDGMKLISRTIQPLSHDIFIASEVADATSSSNPKNNVTLRCTDVYQRGEDDQWLVVNENCSAMPKS